MADDETPARLKAKSTWLSGAERAGLARLLTRLLDSPAS